MLKRIIISASLFIPIALVVIDNDPNALSWIVVVAACTASFIYLMPMRKMSFISFLVSVTIFAVSMYVMYREELTFLNALSFGCAYLALLAAAFQRLRDEANGREENLNVQANQ